MLTKGTKNRHLFQILYYLYPKHYQRVRNLIFDCFIITINMSNQTKVNAAL